MNTCSTCKHWFGKPVFRSFGVCEIAKHVIVHHLPKTDAEAYVALGDKPDDGQPIPGHYSFGRILAHDEMGAADYGQNFAEVVTGPDFGCVKHEPKE